MKLLALIRDYGGVPTGALLLTTVGSGVLAALVVVLVNAATAAGIEVEGWQLGVVFMALVAAMYAVRSWSARLLIRSFEQASDRLRQRFAERLRVAPLRDVEALDDPLTRAAADLAFLSTSLESWVSGVQHLTFAAFTTLGVALISPRALALWCLALGVIAWWLRSRLGELVRASAQLGRESATLGRRFEALLNGMEQAKLDKRVADGLIAEITESSDIVRACHVQREDSAMSMYVGAMTLFFVCGTGVAAFASPATFGLDPAKGYEMISFFNLALAPVFGLISALPQLEQAELAAGSLLEMLRGMRAEFDRELDDEPPRFSSFALRRATFAYREDPSGFRVGPVDLTVQRGELVLVTGGNGSGKTTLLKMLTGLYPLTDGAVVVNGRPLASWELQAWRENVTMIVSRQHLFERLYGLEDKDPALVRSLLARLGIDDIVSYRRGSFTPLALSAGQRMRLAMVVALLEDRPLCVFDEWTANQDPEMTHWFYDELLPELLAAGKTVIAVSHDDRFFSRAAHLVTMEQGRVVREARSSRADPPGDQGSTPS